MGRVQRINAGGTLRPQFKYAADFTAYYAIKKDSYLILTPLGSSTNYSRVSSEGELRKGESAGKIIIDALIEKYGIQEPEQPKKIVITKS